MVAPVSLQITYILDNSAAHNLLPVPTFSAKTGSSAYEAEKLTWMGDTPHLPTGKAAFPPVLFFNHDLSLQLGCKSAPISVSIVGVFM